MVKLEPSLKRNAKKEVKKEVKADVKAEVKPESKDEVKVIKEVPTGPKAMISPKWLAGSVK